jgi:hypothetical protein
MAKSIPSKSPNDDISQPVDAYIVHQDRLDLVDTLMGGTKAMRDARTKYLPQEPEESDKAYENRLQRTVLLNAFRRTVTYLSGQVFSKPLILQDDNPEEVKELTENIDLQNNNLEVFAKRVFEAGLIDGISCILVDYPIVPTDLTKEEEKSANIRPYWVHVPATSIIGWRTKTVGGEIKLTQIRILEEVEKDEGKYGIKTVKRIRLLEPGKYELYEDDSGGREISWKLIEKGEVSFKDEIPLAVFRVGEKISYMTAVPPLEDLAYLNLAHWQSNSDQTNILHFARVPLLFGKLLSDDISKLEIGPNRMIHASREDADLKYVEHTGQAIGAGREDLDNLEQRMALYGLQLLIPKTGRITATEKALSSSENDCTLKTWALIFKDCLEQALVYTAEWMKIDSPGSITVNTEYRLLQTADADVLIKAKVAGILPRRVVLQEFLRRGIIAEDSDVDEIFDMLENESVSSFSGFSNTGLPQPGGTLPPPRVPIGSVKRPQLPNFTKKGKTFRGVK